MVFGFGKKSDATQHTFVEQDQDVPLDQAQPTSTSLLPVFACGAGLFSDGYINNVIGSVSTVLSAEYGDFYTNSNAINNVSEFSLECVPLTCRNSQLNSLSRSQPLHSPAPSWASSSLGTYRTTGAASTP